MERLTERDEFGNADIIGVDSEDLQLNLDFKRMNKVTDALNKLAEYEDFEKIFKDKMSEIDCDFLSDKEEFGLWLDRNRWIAKKCAEYARAEEQGLLLRLPCKVGTKVWTIMCGINGMHPTIFKRDFELSMVEYFGISVFLTKDEAEQKLKEMEETTK